MRIKSIEIINLRSYERIVIELSRNINLLIGANNSGKSTIIKSLLNLQYKVFNEKDVRAGKRYAKIFTRVSETDEKDSYRFYDPAQPNDRETASDYEIRWHLNGQKEAYLYVSSKYKIERLELDRIKVTGVNGGDVPLKKFPRFPDSDALLDTIFSQQDYLWNTDQGKSFKAFWEFLMSESMQKELEELIGKMNEIPVIKAIKQEPIVDRIKTNLVDAGDKVNRSNDGLIEQLRKYVEQRNLSESKHILRSIETIENLLMEHKDHIEPQLMIMDIDGLFRPNLLMERPLFSPPIKAVFEQTSIEEGKADADTNILFEQFFVDIEALRNNIKTALRSKSQVSLAGLLNLYEPTKGVAEVMGYIQIASGDSKHYINNEKTEDLVVKNIDTGKQYQLKAPLIIFNR